MNDRLSILMILHMPWSSNLGGARVQLELANEFIKLGHHVEKFDLNDAFPDPKRSLLNHSSPLSFSKRAKEFVCKNAHRFDVIDAHQGNLPYRKEELGFKGLLIARSVGMYKFYYDFSIFERKQWPTNSLKTWLGNKFRMHHQKKLLLNCIYSYKTSDLINLPNQDELLYVQKELELGHKARVFPFGLSPKRQEDFEKINLSSRRFKRNQVVFIGTWGNRKGAKDWRTIILNVKQEIPDAQFLFLGTGYNASYILSDLELPTVDWLKVIPTYESHELPQLLKGAKVGAFPSYIEGFGFAVLEKLASGIPTIAYDVPGPREMIRFLDSSLLVKVGEAEKFSNKLISLLSLDEFSYSQLSHQCVEVAKKFSWENIAKETLLAYQSAYQEISSHLPC